MPYKDLTIRPADQEKRRTVMLTLTEDCNLRCRYCYEKEKIKNRVMSFNVAKEVITHYMQADDGFDSVEFDFFGGEPMLAFDLIVEIVEWFHTQTWPKRHIFFVGTNGTILTDEMKPYLAKHKTCLTFGLSLDGNKKAHDLNRSNSYDKLMNNFPFYLENWPNQPVKMTISAESIPYVAESIIDLEEKKVLFTANLAFEDIWGSSHEKEILLDEYAHQLDRLVLYYASHPDLFPASIVDVRPENISEPYKPGRLEDCVRWCGAGHELLMFDPDGKYYPCHRFSPWVTGRQAPEESPNRQKIWKPEKCTDCKINSICPTCAGLNWQENGDTSIRTTYHCEAFKLQVLASAKLHAIRILQQYESQNQFSDTEAKLIKRRLNKALDVISNGI